MKLSIVTSVLLATMKSALIRGHCEIFTLVPENPEHCAGEIKCSRFIDDIANTTELWNCVPKDDFDLHLVLQDIEDVFLLKDAELHDYYSYDQIKTVKMNSQSNLTEVPSDIYELFNGVTEIDLSHNSLASINLDSFARYLPLKKINVSHNVITYLAVNVGVRVRPNVNMITTIDISHNKLSRIKDADFNLFNQLNYLNLSHNAVKSLDEFAFLGLRNLKVLDLSNNVLEQTLTSLAPLVNLKELFLQQNKIVSIMDFNFRTLLKLEVLHLNSNKLIYIDSLAFRNMDNLLSINLENNTNCIPSQVNNLDIFNLYSLNRLMCIKR